MIKGMTGFGHIDLSSGKIKGFVEIKTVNHRYLDIAYYLPVGLSSIELKFREILQKKLERGRVTVSLRLTEKLLLSTGLNKEIAKSYLRQSRVLKKFLGLSGDLSIAEIIQLPGVVESKEALQDPEVLWPSIEKATFKAVDSVIAMRKREGESLAKDIKGLLKRMLLQINKIGLRAKQILKGKRGILTGEEFSSFQKSSDVHEELSRMRHHIEEFRRLIDADGAVGKKMDFVAQEMQRETNTIGSKISDQVISNAVIALKSKIEKLREQAQNIE